MCTRLAITLPPDAMARLFTAVPDNDLVIAPDYNLAPSDSLNVVTLDQGARRLRKMRWGFVPRWYKTPTDGPMLVNARAETIAEKPAFRDAVRHSRCLVAATGYYEWSKGEKDERLPWFIPRTDGAPLVLAGVMTRWNAPGADEAAAILTCAIVTCAPSPAMAPIHDRMPVVLEEPDWPLWLGEAGHGAATLMKAAADGTLAPYRVGKSVNSVRADGADLIIPLGAAA